MTVPAKILELIARFHQHSDDYRSGTYNETQLRREFLDPFFSALGWDMDNRTGAGQAMREVVHEYSMKIDGQSKAPDYCFRSGATAKFFVEAKKPAVNLKDDWRPAFQTRTYGWQQKLPFCVLTDFEEFAVYDCRFKPETSDGAQTARIFYCKYSDYPQQWTQIENLFGRAAVLSGSLEQQAATSSKRGALPFDVDFLNLISGWRERLAGNLAQRNRALNLTQSDLNYAVQMTIDRILFLRMCEDRGLEPFEQLKTLRAGQEIYRELLDLFRQADNRYNSGLFHFGAEKARGGFADLLTPQLQIDDYVLADIIYKLYLPSPYNFRTMSVEILGQVYEQFLGKVIRLDGQRASIEEKPEVRKAGGVYYTPSYIVNYIVEQTVGQLCAGKTPAQVAKIKVLDPACGSGSFLIGAYDYLLQWHLEFYLADDPEKHARKRQPTLCRAPLEAGENAAELQTPWRLTTSEKKRILLANLSGVDIDRQAVEVTKLSLLLKMLEDSADVEAPTPQNRLVRLQDRLLPDLEANIKCGNSLIGHDFFAGDSDYSQSERERINAFDWHDEFPEIMQSGGFDAVIGNPPYIRIQALKEWAPLEVEHLKTQYQSASVGNYDIYVVFVERALQLLNKNGRLGYILPHKFFNAQYGAPLRELMANGAHLSDVVHFGHEQVFSGATTYTCLLFADQKPNTFVNIAKVDDLAEWRALGTATTGQVLAADITGAEWNFAIGKDAALFEKLSQMPVKLGDVAERMAQGIRTSANNVYVLNLVEEKEGRISARTGEGEIVQLDSSTTSLFLQGREIKPYKINASGKIVIIPYRVEDGRAHFIPENEFRQNALTYKYLLSRKQLLEEREKGRMSGDNWYAYIYPKNIELMKTPKILVPDIADRASFAFDEHGEYAFTSGYGITFKKDVSESIKYLLGLLNSKVLNFYLRSVSTPMRGGFFRYFTQFIEQLPIRTINFADKTEKAQHDKMVQLVTRMLELQPQRAQARTAQDAASLDRQIAATDRQIDQLVYQLYELTDEEIAIVEAK